MTRTAMDSKDGIWAILNQYDSVPEFCNQAARVMDALMIMDGLWEELNYSYKAAEFAKHIIEMCNHFEQGCNHHMTIQRLNKTKQAAWKVEEHFSHLQTDRMFGQESVGNTEFHAASKGLLSVS